MLYAHRSEVKGLKRQTHPSQNFETYVAQSIYISYVDEEKLEMNFMRITDSEFVQILLHNELAGFQTKNKNRIGFMEE